MSIATTTPPQAVPQLLTLAGLPLPPGRTPVEVTGTGELRLGRGRDRLDLAFKIDGRQFRVTVRPDGDGAVCVVRAIVGDIPFSAESSARRRAVLMILDAARTLPTTRWLRERGERIALERATRIAGRVSPERILGEAVRTVAAARPFLRLLAAAHA